MLKDRSSGILLHITSLPSDFGIGDMGDAAYKFIDKLVECKQKIWQILPISYADETGCPYASYSAFGGFPLLISPEMICDDLNISKKELSGHKLQLSHVDYKAVKAKKDSFFRYAFNQFKDSHHLHKEYIEFCEENLNWLNDFAVFMYISEQYGHNWGHWPEKYKEHSQQLITELKQNKKEEIDYQIFLQFMIFTQWKRLKDYANAKGIRLFGDIPIFVGYHSMDVWKNRNYFKIGNDGQMLVETGAPPDAFTELGQLWNTPNYNWKELEANNYDWWISRMKFMLEKFDIIRIDHFRGLESTWEVPAPAHDARGGHWSKGPGKKLFDAFNQQLGDLNIVLEDLGDITQEVISLRKHLDLPGMKILQFAFLNDDNNEYLPHNYETSNCVVYTGTHDNNTTNGHFDDLHNQHEAYMFSKYKHQFNHHKNNWVLNEMALSSLANISIIPLQDIIGLGSEARFNIPGTNKNNWQWRFEWKDLKEENLTKLKELTIKYNRSFDKT